MTLPAAYLFGNQPSSWCCMTRNS